MLRRRLATFLYTAFAALAILAPAFSVAQPAGAGPAGEAGGLAPGIRQGLDEIRPSALQAHVRFLADDMLEGRDTSTPGAQLAARYIAAQMEQIGLKPAGDAGTYFQQVPFVRTQVVPARSRFLVRRAGAEQALEWGRHFILSSGGRAPAAARGPLVFAGYGITAPEFRHDDYTGLEVRGKLVVVLAGEPASQDPNVFAGTRDTRHSQSAVKADLARGKGAAGLVILLPAAAAANLPWDRLAGFQTRPRFGVAGGPAGRFPVLIARGTAGEALFSGAAKTWPEIEQAAAQGPVPPMPLMGEAEVEVAAEQTDLPSPNVAGLLEGSDPELKRQVVIYTAHYDHVGRRMGAGDTIYNGAWDNASGTASVLEIARAFTRAQPRPRRSILFLLVTGEELGLLGSRYYTERPAFPIEQTAANINLDMTEIFGVPREFVPVGAERSSLQSACERAAKALGMRLGNDPVPQERVFERSDQYSFAQAGVPACILLWASDYEDVDPAAAKASAQQRMRTVYHQPGDHYDPTWSWAGMRRQAQAAFLTGLFVANDPEMPRWNAGDAFNRPRKTPGTLN